MDRPDKTNEPSPWTPAAENGACSGLADPPLPSPALYVSILGTLLTLDFLAPLAARDAQDWSQVMQMAAVMFAAGLGMGQMVLFSLWAALGPEPWYWRLPATFAAVALAMIATGLGLAAFQAPTFIWDYVTGFALVLPLAFCAAQTPGWAIRFLGRRRVVMVHQSVGQRPPFQFRLRHLLGAMAAAAFILGTARVGVAWGREPQLDDWLTAAAAFFAVAVVSAIYAVPAVWVGIGSRRPGWSAVVVGGGLALVGGGFALAAGSAMGARAFVAYLLLFCPFHGALFGVLLGSLLPFRAAGYALRPGR